MEVTRLFDIIYYQKEKYPQKVALAAKVNGSWKEYSTDDCIEMINKVSRGLIGMGIEAGDMIGLISSNRPEWHFVDVAVNQVGAILVPIYPTIGPGEFEYIFNHAELKMVFVENQGLLDKVNQIWERVPSLANVVTFDEIKGETRSKHFTEVLQAGANIEQSAVEARKSKVQTKDLATIIYTSGTTGNPKGVMLSHYNIIENIKATISVLPVNSQHTALSFLPLCHIFERMVLYVYTYAGLSVYFCDKMEELGDYIREVKPHFFSAVPRLLEKVYEKIVSKGQELTGVKKKLFFWALDLGLQYVVDKDMGWWYDTRLKIARKLIFSKWQEALGGNLLGIVTGAAALPVSLAKVFNAAGIPVREGYGQTESSPAVSFNRFEPGGAMEGTVGIRISNCEVKIADNGEILVKGPNVMMGYYKNPQATAETVDSDGWLHTGDVGTLIDGKFLKITDRIKELFKTSGGKYIAPLPLETRIRESFFIEQVMVVGENQKFPGALIVPSFDYLKRWCADEGIPYEDSDRVNSLKNPKIQAKYKEIIAEYNKEWGNFEQIKKFELMPSEWTIDTGELTPTMKVKRRVIMEKYAQYVQSIYASV